ncbi:MAG: helix-turn-helix transcriptional regulator [Acidobacteriia bacterium]|nr:helix-turn-helix transcriptional regulator [Terriglobia bacterium]
MRNHLTALREKKGYTPSELAACVGATTATIKAIENEHCDPGLLLAYDIAEALNACVTDLFPPVPRRVRLEEFAARPWYARLFCGMGD